MSLGLPDKIEIYFDHGIIAPGSDFDLMDFLYGSATDRTGYVPTVANLNSYLNMVAEIAEEQDLPGVIIYTIRPSQNFYSVNHSLQYSMVHVQANYPLLWHHLQILLLDELMSGFHTWAAESIPSQQIESATVFKRVGNTLKPIATFSNQNYVPGTPSVNPAAIDMTDTPGYYIQYGDLNIIRNLPREFCGGFSNIIVKKRPTGNQITYNVCNWHNFSNLKSRVMIYFTGVL